MERMKFIGCPAVLVLTIAVASAGVVAVSGTCALAQVPGFYQTDTPEVTVDMSVLEGSSSRTGTNPLPPAPGVTGRLLVPGRHAPVSRLYVKPLGNLPPIPPPKRGHIALTSPAKGLGLPRIEPPPSTMNTPAKRARSAHVAATRRSTSRRLFSAPPAPKIAAPAPAVRSIAAGAPPPPAIEKPQLAVALPMMPTQPAAPTPPAVGTPQVVGAPQAPAMAIPAPPPAPPGGGAVAVATAEPGAKAQASLPTAGAVKPGQSLQILFEAEGAKLSDQARNQLKGVLQGILGKPELRLQLLAYAGGPSLSSSRARRLSLSRALAVRSYLIENGLRSTRIDVRALGNNTTKQPINRVNVNVVER